MPEMLGPGEAIRNLEVLSPDAHFYLAKKVLREHNLRHCTHASYVRKLSKMFAETNSDQKESRMPSRSHSFAFGCGYINGMAQLLQKLKPSKTHTTMCRKRGCMLKRSIFFPKINGVYNLRFMK